MAANSQLVASLVGPGMVVVGASEIVHAGIWDTIDLPQVHLSGLLLFCGGVAVVRFHNHWTPAWPLFVTLMGWFMIVGGLFRAFAPQVARYAAPVGELPVDAGLVGIGLFLTYMGWRRPSA